MATQPFEGPPGELRSYLGGRGGEELHMGPEEKRMAQEAIEGITKLLNDLGPQKRKEVMNRILGLRRRLSEEDFDDALRAEMLAYGVVLGELPRKPKEARPEEFKNYELNGPLTANMMEERLRMLEDAVSLSAKEKGN